MASISGWGGGRENRGASAGQLPKIPIQCPADHSSGYTESRCISCTPKSSTFEENLERERAVAPPMVPESRLLRTVRAPGTPTVDASLDTVPAARPLARCRQLPKSLFTAVSSYGVVLVGGTSAAQDAATDVA